MFHVRQSGIGHVRGILPTEANNDRGPSVGSSEDQAVLLPSHLHHNDRCFGSRSRVQQSRDDAIRERPLTKFERTRILGTRAKMIGEGSPALVDTEGLTDSLNIAEKELQEGKLNIIINRDGLQVELVSLTNFFK